MKSHDETTDGRGTDSSERDWKSILHAVEAILGLVLAGFLLMAVGIGGLGWLLSEYRRWPNSSYVLMLAGWLIVTSLLGLSIAYVGGRAAEPRYHPLALDIALRQPEYPVVLCPFVALWWMANCLAILWMAEKMMAAYVFFRPGVLELAMKYFFSAMIYFGCAFASNSYLLMAVAAIWRSQGLIRFIWRSRFLLDMGIAAVMVFGPF